MLAAVGAPLGTTASAASSTSEFRGEGGSLLGFGGSGGKGFVDELVDVSSISHFYFFYFYFIFSVDILGMLFTVGLAVKSKIYRKEKNRNLTLGRARLCLNF